VRSWDIAATVASIVVESIVDIDAVHPTGMLSILDRTCTNTGSSVKKGQRSRRVEFHRVPPVHDQWAGSIEERAGPPARSVCRQNTVISGGA
jgi:hypothetical protein